MIKNTRGLLTGITVLYFFCSISHFNKFIPFACSLFFIWLCLNIAKVIEKYLLDIFFVLQNVIFVYGDTYGVTQGLLLLIPGITPGSDRGTICLDGAWTSVSLQGKLFTNSTIFSDHAYSL